MLENVRNVRLFCGVQKAKGKTDYGCCKPVLHASSLGKIGSISVCKDFVCIGATGGLYIAPSSAMHWHRPFHSIHSVVESL